MITDATTVEVYDQTVEYTEDSQSQLFFESLILKLYDAESRLPRHVANDPTWQTIETDEINSASHWYAEGIKTISKLQGLETSYDGYGTRPPNKTAAEYASRVLSALEDLDFQPSAIDPSSDEGICISFRKHNLYADVECFNNGEVFAETKVDGEEPTIWAIEPQEINETITKINSFILG